MGLLVTFIVMSKFSQKTISKCFVSFDYLSDFLPYLTNNSGHVDFTKKTIMTNDFDLKSQSNTEEEGWIWNPHFIFTLRHHLYYYK